jgi:hypothetical protein
VWPLAHNCLSAIANNWMFGRTAPVGYCQQSSSDVCSGFYYGGIGSIMLLRLVDDHRTPCTFRFAAGLRRNQSARLIAIGLALCVWVSGGLAQTSGVAPQQAAFLKIIQDAREEYASGQNDMQKGAARTRRAKAICALLSRLRVENWVGSVAELTTNSEGRGVLAIDIGAKTLVRTWNNAVSDIGDDTLIDPDSTIFATASSLKVGTSVIFSGTLIRSDRDCIREASLSLRGSITAPWYIMRFSVLAKQ